MKKKFFIITIFAISILLLVIFLVQLRTLKNKISNTQVERLSAEQNSNENDTSNADPVTENLAVSQSSTKDIRNVEIQNRIEKYGKNENGIHVLMYRFFYDSSAGGKVPKGMNPFELPRVRILIDDSISSFIAKVKN